MRVFATTLLLSCVGLLPGCILDREHDATSMGSTTQAESSINRITLNSLTINRITLNRITLNQLAMARLSSGQLVFNSLDGLETTPEGRELLAYIVRCALADGVILVAQHDDITYEFPGLLGLAPDWEYRALTASETSYMSACLIAHVNAYGVSVPISVRSHGVLGADSEEMSQFPVYEGTFFGDVFGAELKTYACLGELPEIAMQHSSSRSLRICADLTGDCEVISVGRCQDVCDTYHPRYGWQSCWAEGALYTETISVYLRDDTNDGLNRWCGPDGVCSFECTDGNDAILDCSEASGCAATCTESSTCTLTGDYALGFTATVSEGSIASVTCHEAQSGTVDCSASQCDIGCTGVGTLTVTADALAAVNVGCREADNCMVGCYGGSSCDIDCTDANDCQSSVTCTGGASCLLQCDNAASCGFAVCEGTLEVCDDGSVACNRPCTTASAQL